MTNLVPLLVEVALVGVVVDVLGVDLVEVVVVVLEELVKTGWLVVAVVRYL